MRMIASKDAPRSPHDVLEDRYSSSIVLLASEDLRVPPSHLEGCYIVGPTSDCVADSRRTRRRLTARTHTGPIPRNMDTANLGGEIYFDLRSIILPVECAGGFPPDRVAQAWAAPFATEDPAQGGCPAVAVNATASRLRSAVAPRRRP